MILQRLKVWEGYIAMGAGVGFLSSVCSYVMGQRVGSSKCLGRQIAAEWFFTSVHFHMRFQITRCSERHITQIAGKWLLPWMNPIMYIQGTFLWEGCITLSAGILWDRIWLYKVELCEKPMLQLLQKYGFTPVWVRICASKMELGENLLSQCLQKKWLLSRVLELMSGQVTSLEIWLITQAAAKRLLSWMTYDVYFQATWFSKHLVTCLALVLHGGRWPWDDRWTADGKVLSWFL